MAISIQVAQTPKELDDVFRLRYHVFVVEDNKFDLKALSDKRIFDRFDTYPSSNVNLIAYDGDLPIGTVRFTEDSELGLPQEELVDVNAIRNNRRHPGKFFGIGMLAVRHSYRRRMGFLTSILKYLISLLRMRNGSEAVVLINHMIEKMMIRLGFQRMGDKFYSEKIRNYVVPMYGTMEGVPPDFREDRLADELSRFPGGFMRKIFNKGDVICRQGETGDGAYIVLRGSVNVLPEEGAAKDQVAVIGPGALIDEMSLIEEKPRSSTLEANGRETELMVLSLDRYKNPLDGGQTLVGMPQMSAERLGRMNLTAIEERRQDIRRGFLRLSQEFKRVNEVFRISKDYNYLRTIESAAEELGAYIDQIRPSRNQYFNDKASEADNSEPAAVGESDFDEVLRDSA